MRRRRIVVVFLAAMLGYAVILAQLVRLQVVESDTWVRESHRSSSRFRSLPFDRGWIFDRRGEPLALTEEVDDLAFEYRAWRRGSVAGLVSGASWVLGGPWRPPAEMRAALADALPLFGRLTVRDVAALQPRDRRRDLGFYIERLFGEPLWDAVVARLRADPVPVDETLDSLPGFAPGLAESLSRAAREDDAWRRLGTLAGVDLDQEVDELARNALDKVADALGLEPGWSTASLVERESYNRLQALQAEFESDAVVLTRDVLYDATTMVAIRGADLGGFSLRSETRRVYPPAVSDVAPLVVGMVGEPRDVDIDKSTLHRGRMAWLASLDDLTPEEVDEYERLRVLVREIDYAHTEERGRLGLESAFEDVLRGKRGWESVWLDVDGEARREQEDPVRGLDITLTLDVDLQRAAQEVLDAVFRRGKDVPGAPPTVPAHWSGAVVLLDPRDGDVLALATSPRPSRQAIASDYPALESDPWRPLQHRAVYAGASGNPPPPGSTFKPVSALAGLASGVIDADTHFLCEGGIEVGGRRLGCLGVHGEISLDRALAVSCNVYFYRVGSAVGAERLAEMAQRFGFGSDTTLISRNERLQASGLVTKWGMSEASPRIAPGPWTRTQAMTMAIGQAPLDDVTPLQVAAMMASIGTGNRVVPRLLASVEGWPLQEQPPRPLELAGRHLALVRAGLARVVDDAAIGTARRLTLMYPELASQVAAKTGTAEVGAGKRDHSWFAGYLPRQSPRLAFAVLIEDCDLHGSEGALPVFLDLVAKPAVDRFLNDEVLRDGAEREVLR